MNKRFSWSNLYLLLVFFIMYLPILYLVFYSFNAGGTMYDFTGFTWEHYQTMLEDKQLLINLFNTIVLAVLSGVVATIIGSLGALGIYFLKSKKERDLTLNLNNILLITPDVMLGASFLIMFVTVFKASLGFYTVFWAHVAFSVPIVVLMVLPRLYEMDTNMLIAARDLGASNLQTLIRVILPSIKSGIISGFLMAFTYSLDDFAVTFFVTGGGFSTLSVEVYTRARRGVTLEVNALSTIIFLVSLALVLGYYFISKRKSKLQNRGGQL